MIFQHFDVNISHDEAAKFLSMHVSPQSFYLHNRVGGKGWNVTRSQTHKTKITLDGDVNPALITLLLLQYR